MEGSYRRGGGVSGTDNQLHVQILYYEESRAEPSTWLFCALDTTRRPGLRLLILILGCAQQRLVVVQELKLS